MTTNDIDAIRREWLRQCGPCDAGLLIGCTCPPGDVRSVLSALCDEIEQLRARLAAAEPKELTEEPGPEVTRVIDDEGDLWIRSLGGWRFRDGTTWKWAGLAAVYGPMKAVEP